MRIATRVSFVLASVLLVACSDTNDKNEVCDDGQASCSGTCVDLQSDTSNCGACGQSCGADQQCINGSCTIACDDDRVSCGGVCVATVNDARNCGACGQQCAAGMFCESGACVSGCTEPHVACGASCVDTLSDEAHCGGCANAGGSVCTGAQRCVGGTCRKACTSNAECGTEANDSAYEASSPIADPYSNASWGAQGFNAVTDKQVVAVEARVSVSAPGTLVAEVRDGPSPMDATVLATAVATVTAGQNGWVRFEFASPFRLVQDDPHTITLRAIDGAAFGWYVAAGNPYSGGQKWTSSNAGATWMGQPTSDYEFRVRVADQICQGVCIE